MLFSYAEHKAMLTAEIAKFPALFGLAAFPGELFRVSRTASYFRNMEASVPTLYTERLTAHGWSDHAKGTPSEVRQQMTPAPLTIAMLQRLREGSMRQGDYNTAALADLAVDGSLSCVSHELLTGDARRLAHLDGKAKLEALAILVHPRTEA
jgi:hypothetical protein